MFPTTVQFGTRLTAAPSSDDDNEEYENPPVHIGDVCTDAVECNAVKECALGSDETTCGEQAHAKHTCLLQVIAFLTSSLTMTNFSPVRFGKNNSLQVRTSQDSRFLPVCYSGWDRTVAQETCAALGFRE